MSHCSLQYKLHSSTVRDIYIAKSEFPTRRKTSFTNSFFNFPFNKLLHFPPDTKIPWQGTSQILHFSTHVNNYLKIKVHITCIYCNLIMANTTVHNVCTINQVLYSSLKRNYWFPLTLQKREEQKIPHTCGKQHVTYFQTSNQSLKLVKHSKYVCVVCIQRCTNVALTHKIQCGVRYNNVCRVQYKLLHFIWKPQSQQVGWFFAYENCNFLSTFTFLEFQTDSLITTWQVGLCPKLVLRERPVTTGFSSVRLVEKY